MADNVPDVRAVLAAGRRSRWKRWVAPAILLALVAGGAAFYLSRSKEAAGGRFETVTTPARRGDLQSIVTATGNLKGLDTVDVGAEINGRIKAVNVDFNDRVTAGQVLCEIDPLQLTANRDQSRAQVVAAEAELRNRRATAREARQTADRTTTMSERGLVSAQALETAVAAADRAEAAVASAEAQITVARAQLVNTETALQKAWVKSPIDGVVLSRTVEVGQTVNATMQTPVLFSIAKDLTRMELTIAIDEADIGQVKEGQSATFTVDAFPGKTFPASVRLIQNVGTVTDNVVTYQARLTIDNAELLLRPGMTATVNVLTAERKGVLLVPNAALRFKPPVTTAPEVRNPLIPGPPMRARSSGGGGGAGAGGGAGRDEGPAVYVQKGTEQVRVRVKTGLSDGTSTEVTPVGEGPQLAEGDAVITDVIERKKK